MPASTIEYNILSGKKNFYLPKNASDSYDIKFSIHQMEGESAPPLSAALNGLIINNVTNTINLDTLYNLLDGVEETITRTVNGIGRQRDKLFFFYEDTGAVVNEINYDYVSLKKATALTQINNTNAVNNATFNTNLGTAILFQKGLNYGAEISSYWVIQKSSLDGDVQNVNAIQGVDYQLVGSLGNSSSFGSNDITVTFLTNYNFKVINYASGYTFASNPYQNFTSDLTPNNSTFITNVTIAGTSNSYTYDQLTPELTPVFTSNGVTSNSPLTIYKNRNITCNVTLSNGWWKRINGSTVTVLTKTNAEWLEDIFLKCDVKLEIRNISNNSLLKSIVVNAFPFTFLIESPGNYKAQIILTKKP